MLGNCIGFNFGAMKVLKDEKGQYYLDITYLEDPVPCPKGAELTKILTKDGSKYSFMGVELGFLGYECPVTGITVFFFQHPGAQRMQINVHTRTKTMSIESVDVGLKPERLTRA